MRRTRFFRSLHSRICPSCGAEKNAAQAFCRPCFVRLPKHLKRPLYCRTGTDYCKAVNAALADLKVTVPHWVASDGGNRD